MRIAGSATSFAAAFAVTVGVMGALDASAQTTIKVALATSSTVNHLPLYVAIGGGFFEKEGLVVDAQGVGGSSGALQALIAGQAALAQAGPGPFLSARARGEDLTFIYNYYTKNTFALLTQKDAGISSAADLKGKTIGVDSLDGPQVALARNVMKDLGLEEDKDYKILNVGEGGPAVAGFSRGDIQAYVGSAEDAAIMTARGLGIIDITPEKFAELFGNGYIARSDWLKENEDVVRAFGRAMAKASKFVADPANRQKAIEIGKARNPLEYKDMDVVEKQLEQVVGKFTPADKSRFGASTEAGWNAWHQAMLNSGGLKEPLPDLSAVYTNAYVDDWNKE